jgi:hypothetical protein
MALVADEQATRWFLPAPGPEQPQANVDTGVAHIARIYNYWLGGKDNISQVVSVTPHSDRTKPIQARHGVYSKIAWLAVA